MDCFFRHNKIDELIRYEYSLHRKLKLPIEAICAYNIVNMVLSGYAKTIMPLLRAHDPVIFVGPSGSIILQPEKVEGSDIERIMQITI